MKRIIFAALIVAFSTQAAGYWAPSSSSPWCKIFSCPQPDPVIKNGA